MHAAVFVRKALKFHTLGFYNSVFIREKKKNRSIAWPFASFVFAYGRARQHKWKIVDKRPKEFWFGASLLANCVRFYRECETIRLNSTTQQQPHLAFLCVVAHRRIAKNTYTLFQ